MKMRIAASIVGVLALGVIAALAVSILRSRSIADDEFRDSVLGFGHVDELHIEAARSLPVAVSIRFPPDHSNGGLGFPDRTDVYSVGGLGGTIDCRADVRSNRVCYVTFAGKGDPASLRASIRHRFPGLSTD